MAFAKLEVEAPQLFYESVNAHLHDNKGLLASFKPQGISNLLLAFAKLDVEAPQLFEAVDALLQDNPGLLDKFNPQNISNLLWSYAEQRHDAPGLFNLISIKQVVQRLDECNDQELSMTARAYAVLYIPGGESIIQAALQRAVNDPNAFDPQHLAIITNAAVVELDAATLKVFASAMASIKLQEEGYHSVFQAYLGLQLSSPDSLPASFLPGPMHDSARRLWQEQAKDVRPSDLQKGAWLVRLRDGDWYG